MSPGGTNSHELAAPGSLPACRRPTSTRDQRAPLDGMRQPRLEPIARESDARADTDAGPASAAAGVPLFAKTAHQVLARSLLTVGSMQESQAKSAALRIHANSALWAARRRPGKTAPLGPDPAAGRGPAFALGRAPARRCQRPSFVRTQDAHRAITSWPSAIMIEATRARRSLR
jgi:hypothetical protein